MKKLIRYDSIEELKDDSKPATSDDAQSAQRHERFMGFLEFLKDDAGKDAEPATNKPAADDKNPAQVLGLFC